MYMDKKSAKELADQVLWLEQLLKRVWRVSCSWCRRMRKKVRDTLIRGMASFMCFAFLITTAVPNYALASECVEPVAVKSPCAGVLLPPKAAELGLKCLRVEVPKLTLELDYLKKERASFEKYHTSILEAERNRSAAFERQIEVLLKKDLGQKWYESPTFHFAIGFITASAVTIGITYAVNND